MQSHIIIPPNLNGKVYREFFPQQNSINMFLDFVDIQNDQVLLGSSNLNGRFWNGSICYFTNVKTESVFDLDQTYSFEYLDNGVTDGKIIPNTQNVLISQDSGQVKLYNAEDNNLKLCKIGNQEHDEFVTELSMWDCKSFVTGSADSCIKIWSITENDISCVNSLNEVHSNCISSVNANALDLNLFASCSYDGTALLWDKRSDEPGKLIYENEFCALNRIEWHPSKSNLLTVCNSSGDVYLVDVREPKEFVSKNSCFKRAIHRTKFNPQGLLAVCADDSKLIVLDCNNDDMKVTYIDDRHSDFVRGLSWRNNLLISCGWDKQVLLHQL